MEPTNLYTATEEKDIVISGEGTRGRPIRLYLVKSEFPFTIIMKDTEINEDIMTYENCKTERILYYRLKNNNILKIKNKNGKIKLI